MKHYKEDNNSVLIIGGAIVFIIAVLLGGYLFNHRSVGDDLQAEGDLPPAVQDEPEASLEGDVAIIDGRPMTREEFEKDIDIILFLQGMPPEYKQYVPEETLLNQTIVQEIIYRKAVDSGYASDISQVQSEFEDKLAGEGVSVDEYKGSLDGLPFTYDDIIGFYAKQKTMGLFLNDTLFVDDEVGDEEARAYYDGNPAEFNIDDQVSASHILVDTSEEAEDLIRQLEDGADFAELAKEHSTCPSAPEGGDLGTFGAGAMVPEFEAAAFALEDIGDYTHEPVETQFGYHIILLSGRTEAGQVTFEEAKDSIIEGLTLERRGDAINAYIEEILAESEIEILI